MIATGLVGIGLDFHKGPGATASLISVLYLCSAVMQPTMGKLSTIFGPRKVFLAGIGILLFAGVIGAAAPSFGFLVLSRALIGVGTSAAYPTAMALVRRRAIFFVNVPLALITLVFTLLGVAKDTQERAGGQRLFSAVDALGIALFAGTIVSLLVFLSDLGAPRWWLLALAVLLGAALIGWELRASSPLIDVRLLRGNQPLLRTYLRQAIASLGIYTALYGTSQWMEQSAHYSAAKVGLILLPLSGLSIVIARLVSGRGWVRWPLILSAAALLLTGGVMLLISNESGVLALIGMSLLFGFTNGFSGFANQAALYVQSPADGIAVASGLYRTFTYFGAIFSSSLIGITFGNAASDHGFHTVALGIGGIGIVLLLLTVFDKFVPSRTNA